MTEKNFKAGDIIYSQHTDGTYLVFKILAVESYPDATTTWHLMCFEPLETIPQESDIVDLVVNTYHVPIKAFSDTATVVTNVPITEQDTAGYFMYLKENDFPRYVSESGIKPEEIVATANEYYNAAYAEPDKEKAIAEYAKAVDLFPLFYEAIDNMALLRMDLGDFTSAANDLKKSLEVNPDNFLAWWKLGFCQKEIQDFDSAKESYEKALAIQPDAKVAAELASLSN